MSVGPHAQRFRITVEVDIGSEPIRGSFDDGTGPVIEFAGWLELISAFETASATASAGMDLERQPGG